MALEDEVDEELGGGEEEIEDEGAPGEGGAEEERAVEPEDEVDDERCDEGLVEAAGVGCGQGLDCFLEGVSGGLVELYVCCGQGIIGR